MEGALWNIEYFINISNKISENMSMNIIYLQWPVAISKFFN